MCTTMKTKIVSLKITNNYSHSCISFLLILLEKLQ